MRLFLTAVTLGVYLYVLLKKIPFRELAITSLFATALGPPISVLSFGLGLTLWKGILAGYCAGIAIGFVIPPLADAFYNFHRGFNLYNNVSYLHGGMNLYNNGFSGGFVTATLAPLYKAIAERRRLKKEVS